MPGRPDAHRRHAPRRHRLPTAAAAIAAVLLLPAVPLATPAMVDAAALRQASVRCAVPSTLPASVAASASGSEAEATESARSDAPAIRRSTPAAAANPAPRPPLSDASLTPVATPRPTAPPVTPDPQDVFATELRSVAEALAACLSDGSAGTVLDLATENYLGQLYAGGAPLTAAEYLDLAAALDPVPVRIVGLENARGRGEEIATAAVTSVVGNQLLREEWRFVQRPAANRRPGESAWRVDGAEPLPPTVPRGATELAVTLAEYSITIDGPAATGDDVVLTGTNLGAEDHEMLVLRFENGFTTGDLLRAAGPSLPDEVRWVGQATVPAGATSDLILTDLESGTYTVVCLLPTDRGTPHLALGMAAAFEVE